MPPALLLRAGPRLLWVTAAGLPTESVLLAEDPLAQARATASLDRRAPESVIDALRRNRPAGPVSLSEPALASPFSALGPFAPIPPSERRALRERAWPARRPAEREFYLALARGQLASALALPVETLITLAREEERLERSVRRQAEATTHLLGPPEGPVEEHRRESVRIGRELAEHLARLLERLEEEARRTVPNLSAVVGPRVAARLVARAGGVSPLARMSASRLQLLGSRRRPGPGRSPRFGVLFRAEEMERVPPSRQGAFARSLAALAAIAVRVDAATRADRSAELLRRRERRLSALRQGGP